MAEPPNNDCLVKWKECLTRVEGMRVTLNIETAKAAACYRDVARLGAELKKAREEREQVLQEREAKISRQSIVVTVSFLIGAGIGYFSSQRKSPTFF